MRINFQSSFCCRACLWKCVGRSEMAVKPKRHITLSEPRIGESVSWIAFDGLTKVLNCAMESLSSSLPPMKSSLQIKMVCLDVFGVSLRQKIFFLRREFQPQLLRNLLRDVFF